jgi:hypothetical protein
MACLEFSINFGLVLCFPVVHSWQRLEKNVSQGCTVALALVWLEEKKTICGCSTRRMLTV